VIGVRVLPPEDVQIRVELANGAAMTVAPHDAMWLVIVQRCGEYAGTALRSVELLAADGSLIERQILEPDDSNPAIGGLAPWLSEREATLAVRFAR
jgi:hypothetical protein